ncbi:MAG: Holliday junction resolvase RuvX [Desulfovibrio sp.]|nr:Holliday junction resolvase RuvX [Desulfovibrio sp.]
MGIDYGLERTGLAMSDPEGRMAVPLRVLELSEFGSRKKQLDALADIAAAYGIEAIALGLPLHGDGSESGMSRQARNIGARIGRRLNLPVFLVPEFLSSFEAGKDLEGCKKRAACLDAQAACRILASFLEQPEHARLRL